MRAFSTVGKARRRAIGALLGSAALCFACATGARAESIKIGGTGTGLGTMKRVAQEFGKRRPQAQLIITPSLGSTGAIKSVLAGSIDIGISARPLKPDEEKQGASARAYARTPFAVATNAKNRATALTGAQLAQMYGGKLAQWPDGTPVRLVLRPEGDADSIALRAFSPELSAALALAQARKGMRVSDTDQDNADALEQLSGSLGMTTLTQVVSEGRAIKLLDLDGVRPTLRSLAAGTYPHAKTLYLVLGPRPSPLAQEFIAFLRSSAGQAVLAANGNLALPE